MTAIERTAYPRFKSQPTAQELAALYTPTRAEIEFVQAQVRSKSRLLSLMVMLKSFQRVGLQKIQTLWSDDRRVRGSVVYHE